eukprot:TRINITY_DN849_c0_g3_i1.p1 TRINITY_DN849_c0_g3~~TRINITY_DN849_c0_g3_i1.p1  ORF type:complete len:186 (-),score=54.91 TRINITY_DN849_c0_g3_i1:62-619(-)
MNSRAIACIALFCAIGVVVSQNVNGTVTNNATVTNTTDIHNLPPCLQEIGYLQDNLQALLQDFQKGQWFKVFASASICWTQFQQVVQHCRPQQANGVNSNGTFTVSEDQQFTFSMNAECRAVLSEFLNFVQKEILPKGQNNQENPQKSAGPGPNFAKAIENAKKAASYAGRLRQDCRIPITKPSA